MTITAVVLFVALIIAYEAPPLYRQERYKDLVAFSILTVLGLTLSILLLLDFPLGSPAKYIESLTNFIWKMFKTAAVHFTP